MRSIFAVVKTGCRFTTAGFLYLFCSPLLASEVASEGVSEVSAYLGSSRWLYQEHDSTGEELNREQGYLQGYWLSLATSLAPSHQWRVDWRRQAGVLSYRGQTQSGVPHNTTTLEGSSRLRVGWRYQPQASGYWFQWWAGHELWQRNIRASDGVAALNERYRWDLVMLDLGYNWRLNAQQRVSISAQAGHLFNGELEVYLNRFGFGSPDIALKYGRLLGVAADYQLALTERWRVTLKYQLEHRQFEQSRPVSASNGVQTIQLREPKNTLQSSALWIGGSWFY